MADLAPNATATPNPASAPSVPASSATPPQAASPSPAPVAATPQPSPSTPNSTPTTPDASSPQSQQQVQAQGIRDALAAQGFDVSQFGNDHQALQHLALAYRQMQTNAPLIQAGQQYVQHADKFQAWLKQTQAQEAEQKAKSWWKAPDFDPQWRSKLTKDPQTGEIKALPGAPPDLVQKYLAAVEHQQSFLDKFAFDPMGAIGPGIQEMVQKLAGEMIQQHLGGYQEQNAAKNFVEQNAGWIYQSLPSGQRVLTPAGQQLGQYVQEAENMGIKGVEQQQRYAVSMLQRDQAMQRLQTGAQAPAQGDLLKQQFVNNAAAGAIHQPNATGSITPPTNPNNPPPSPFNGKAVGQRDLMAFMLEQMKANGFQPGQKVDLQRQ